jgi:type IV pilus assembly protein PilN
MRIPLNLSSEPFRRDRAMMVASAAVSGVLVLTLVVFASLAFLERERAREARETLARLNQELNALAAQQARLQADLRRPENAAVFRLNRFLNILLARKAVSWTKIFNDLENVLPHDVRVVSVRPQLDARNELLLDLVVASQSSEPVLNLVVQLERSPLFGTTTVHSWQPPSQTEPQYRYRISVTYAQRL